MGAPAEDARDGGARKHAGDVLAAAWTARGHRRTLLRAAIALALSFDTWRTLVREQQLEDEQALEVALRLACECEPQ